MQTSYHLRKGLLNESLAGFHLCLLPAKVESSPLAGWAMNELFINSLLMCGLRGNLPGLCCYVSSKDKGPGFCSSVTSGKCQNPDILP